jgi:lipoprotein NlpI
LAIFRGETSEEELLRAARHKGERCEAYYYMGCFQLIRGEKKKAAAYFRKARQTEAFGYMEFHQAKARLRELGFENE